jgi:hypothetical protein
MLRVICATLLALATAAGAAAGETDWAALADRDTVKVVTTDEDGDERTTTIWLLVQDGNGYIRTSKRSTWGDNVERNPEIALRVDDTDHPFRAVFITDAAEREAIVAGFDAKYGHNVIIDWIRGDDPRIMRLDPR